MKTQRNIIAKGNKSHIATRVRTVLTLAGIIVAIICSMFLMQYDNAARGSETPEKEPNRAKMINAGIIVNAGSAIWSLR